MFASRFRESAARALLLPRRRPDRRTPLWQQRQKAADLLTVAAKHPTFPILLEATRECLNDVFDLPALRQLLRDLRSRKVRVVPVDTAQASPFAQSLLFGWIAVYMYSGDAPLAERRAAALALDRDLLRELLGAEELRELLDPDVLADLEAELQHLVEGRRARDADEVHDLLRLLGPLTRDEIAARSEPFFEARTAHDEVGASKNAAEADTLAELTEARRVIRVGIAGEERFAAAEDAARLRDALGCAIPLGLPGVFTESVDAPLVDLVARYARTHGPFVTREVAARFGVDVERIRGPLDALAADGRVVQGEFRPDGVEREWCDDDVLRQLRRRSLAALRREVEPVDAEALARFLPRWQGVGLPRRGVDGLVEVLGVLQGAALPASVLEASILPARLPGYRAADLDALCTSGDLVWVGAGSLGATDGRVRLVFRDQVDVLVPVASEPPPAEPLHEALRDQLLTRGASFWPELLRAAAAADQAYDDAAVMAALWDLVWAGEVTNDSLAPLRAFVGGRGRKRAGATAGRPRGRPRPGRLNRVGPPAAAGRWSLVAPLRLPLPGHAAPSPTEVAHAQALQLLERYGVLTREAALGEGIEGGFAGVYPGAQGARGARCGAPWLLRRRARGGPVRVAGCGGPLAGRSLLGDDRRHARARSGGRRRRVACWCWPRSIRPSRTARRFRGRSRPAGRVARRAPTSCWPTARSWPTWNAAVAAWSRSPPRRSTRAGSTRCSAWSRTVRIGRSSWPRSTASRSVRRAWPTSSEPQVSSTATEASSTASAAPIRR